MTTSTEPKVCNGFVFNLHEDLRPLYRLNPFNAEQVVSYSQRPESYEQEWLKDRFQGRPFTYTANGRQAIREALKMLHLTPDDCVTILTSTGNFYISGCVTSEIATVCQWSRQLMPNTKALFVNHEFGVPYPDLISLKGMGLPIIEDCCYAFNSATEENQMGRVGDYALYSFAKYFPIQFGGLLVGPMGQVLPNALLDVDTQAYLLQAMAQMYPTTDAIAVSRLANHASLARVLAPLGIVPRFDFSTCGVPGVFVFVAPKDWSLPDLKDFMWDCGIHCSVFYGEQAFFIPVHQRLNNVAVEYFSTCLHQFVSQQKHIV